MIGTVVNALAIVVGGAIGVIISKMTKSKDGVSSKKTDAIVKVMGMAVVVLGMKMALQPHDFLSVLICIALGTFLGELIRIEDRVAGFGEWLKRRVGSSSGTFVDGFVSASVLFCVGATAVLGSLDAGIKNDPSLLFVKSVFDGIFSLIFAGTMGIGVLFSAIPVFMYQGLLTLGASQLTFLTANDIYINGISATGGILVIGIGLNIMQLTKLRIGNMLPAILMIVIYDAIYINFVM